MFRFQPYTFQQPQHSPPGIFFIHHPMYPQWFQNGVPYRLTRIERGVRILKNKLNIPTQRLQLTGRQRINTLALKGNHPALALHQTQQRPPGGRFAATGFPHQR
jgi:hypothetical protein